MDREYSLKPVLDETPLVSVIIPAYNAERFIAQTLASVLAQTYSNLEVLVVDDGSQDGTAAIVREFMQRDARIQLLRQSNAGVAAARNFGIAKSQGELIAPLDADDIWFPENIERQVRRLDSVGQEVGLGYAWSMDIDEYGQPTGCARTSRIEGNVYATLLLHDFIANASSVLIRKSSLDRVGGYDSSLRQNHGQGGEDWDIYLRIAENYEFRVVPELLVGYRRVSGSMSTDSVQMARSRHLIWQKIYQKYPRIPSLIERLSNGSFYLHLAAQNYQESRHQAAIEWATKAFSASPITTLLSPSLYKVLFAVSISSFLQTKRFVRMFQLNKAKSLRPMQELSLWRPKAAGEILIHFLASSFLGTAEQWL